MRPPRVLLVGGSDSGGGAGIQGDIKTASALGVYAATAVTAITAQNTKGVTQSHAVPAAIVAAQIDAVISDIGADAVKTGMLVSEEIVTAVAGALASCRGIPLVVDTVISAKHGAVLLDVSGVRAMKNTLFPMATLITPNVPEAERLTGIAIRSIDDMKSAAAALRDLGARAVLVKGGHLPGAFVTDILMSEDGLQQFSGARITNPATHGTGCALATAIAAGLARGLNLPAAVEQAREFVRAAIEHGLELGTGVGPIHHLYALR